MYIALAGLDKWARNDNGDMSHSNKHCYVNDVWYHIWQTVQLAEYALVHEVLLGCEMSIVVDVMRTFITIRCNGTTLRLRVVVEGEGEHHWQIHQHQQPGKPHSSIVNNTHCPKLFISLLA